MDYNTFRSGGGYNARGTPPPAVARESAEPVVLPKELDGKEGRFSELPVTGGVGPFHINHFIGYGGVGFLTKPADVVTPYAARFYDEFVDLFVPNEATAQWGKYYVNGVDTIEFSLGGKEFELLEHLGGLVHSDWISIQKTDAGQSFYGSTLRRQWLLDEEEALVRGLETLSPKAASALIEFIRVNQHHFLAGRRSFRVGYDPKLFRLYVETAAFERNSLCEYHLAEKTGLFRQTIIDLWTNLIDNVQTAFGGRWMQPFYAMSLKAKEGYKVRKGVEYRTGEFETAKEALSQPWFADVLSRHPGLLKGLSL